MTDHLYTRALQTVTTGATECELTEDEWKALRLNAYLAGQHLAYDKEGATFMGMRLKITREQSGNSTGNGR
ncbi:hypothetical protein WHT83_08160 [Aminobacter sp. P9b]|uniref:hypothetical protein n=1 Tax=Aminobacter sp. P9b TaxID=3133697 RepID=UPI003243FCE1